MASSTLNFAKAARAGLSEEEIEKMNANTEIVAVIEIHHDTATTGNQGPARQEQPIKNTHSNQVKPDATEAAHEMFRKCRNAIVGTKYRNELELIYREVFPHSTNVSFAEVLFAMAKGLKLVNVFSGGKNLEWHIGKYQPPKKDTRVKKFQTGNGFTTYAKVAPVAERPQLDPVATKTKEPIQEIDPIEALKLATQDLKETEEFLDEYRQKHHQIGEKIKGMVHLYESGTKNKRVLERVLDFEDAVFKLTAAVLDDLWSARQSFCEEKEYLKTKI